MSRHQIEKFYGVKEVSLDLVRLDDHGKYRKQVRFYSVFVANRRQLAAYALSEQWGSVTERDDLVRKCKLLKKLLRAAGVVDKHGNLDTFAEFETSTLGAFVEAVELHTPQIGLVLEARVRDDLWDKPMMQLSVFLKMIGLKTTKRSKYAAAKKLYRYQLDLSSIEQIEQYRKHYAQGLDEAHVQPNVLTGGQMLVVLEGVDKPKREQNTMLIDLHPIEPDPFDNGEGLIPLTNPGD